jgi:acyl phosphate:glycerol-3-phosphate acyltransferase
MTMADSWFSGLAVVCVAYLIGGIPFGLILVRLMTGGDVRTSGSGNIGATNVMRTTGKAAGILTLVLDAAKGSLAVYLTAHFTGGNMAWMSAAAAAVIGGHVFSPYLKFTGGKGVATFTGAFLFLTPAALVVLFVLFVAAVCYQRYISFASVFCAIVFPLGVWLIHKPGLPVMLAAIFASALVIYKHKENIERLLAGTERKFTWSSRKG